MIIYTDNINSNMVNGSSEMTPAHVYSAVRDFATILDDIGKGDLPVNTHLPFPVNWENKEPTAQQLWSANNTQSFYNPT